MEFRKWVDNQGGAGPVAALLGVKPHTVRVWTRGDGRPKASTALKIVRLSKGRVAYSDLFGETRPPRKRR